MNLSWIKKVYLYMVSLISLVILVIAGIMLINMGLKAWVFTKADDANFYPVEVSCEEIRNPDGSMVPLDAKCKDPEYTQKYEAKQREEERVRRSAQKQRDAAQALAMIIVATPVFLYHWRLARKEA